MTILRNDKYLELTSVYSEEFNVTQLMRMTINFARNYLEDNANISLGILFGKPFLLTFGPK